MITVRVEGEGKFAYLIEDPSITIDKFITRVKERLDIDGKISLKKKGGTRKMKKSDNLSDYVVSGQTIEVSKES